MRFGACSLGISSFKPESWDEGQPGWAPLEVSLAILEVAPIFLAVLTAGGPPGCPGGGPPSPPSPLGEGLQVHLDSLVMFSLAVLVNPVPQDTWALICADLNACLRPEHSTYKKISYTTIGCPASNQCTSAGLGTGEPRCPKGLYQHIKDLAQSTEQRNFDHIFPSIPVLNGTKKEDFFEWIETPE